MGSDNESINLSTSIYRHYFSWYNNFLNFNIFNSILYTQGDTKHIEMFNLGVAVNILLNPIFIFGFFIIPAFGIAGLAISTLLYSSLRVFIYFIE